MNPKITKFIEDVCKAAKVSSRVSFDPSKSKRWEAEVIRGRSGVRDVNRVRRSAKIGELFTVENTVTVPSIDSPGNNGALIYWTNEDGSVTASSIWKEIEKASESNKVAINKDFPNFYAMPSTGFGKVYKSVKSNTKDNASDTK